MATLSNQCAFAHLAKFAFQGKNGEWMILGMKSKPGENVLSLQCKDSTPYPLPPLYLYRSIFTRGHL